MTQIFEDNVQVDLQIGTTSEGFSQGSREPGTSVFSNDAIFWDVIEMEVEITQVAMPNYVKGKVTIQPQFIDDINKLLNPDIYETDAPDDTEDSVDDTSAEGNIPNNGISRLVGSRFRLEVENDFVAVETDDEEGADTRSTSDAANDVEKDSLLFDGRLANISPIGTNLYEVIAYDPGQQAFNIGEESGSVVNQKLELTGDSVDNFRQPQDASDNNEPGEHTISATSLVQSIVEEASLGSKTVIDVGDQNIQFTKSVVTVKKALNKVREETNSEWWFDKDGTFYFGDPGELGGGVRTYQVSLITDTSAGITTPPYQSVRVIGSGVATTEGWAGNSQIQDDDDKIVQEANIGLPESAGTQSEVVVELDPEDELAEPTFKYINAELSTDQSVQNTVLKIADELIKQQAEGKVTVVGFPEIQPFDGILMPNTKQQPMGGQLYEVYSVKHKINGSDGFLTEIEVAGPNPRIRKQIDTTVETETEDGETEEERGIIATSVERDVYTPDGERRAFGPGAGSGDN